MREKEIEEEREIDCDCCEGSTKNYGRSLRKTEKKTKNNSPTIRTAESDR